MILAIDIAVRHCLSKKACQITTKEECVPFISHNHVRNYKQDGKIFYRTAQ